MIYRPSELSDSQISSFGSRAGKKKNFHLPQHPANFNTFPYVSLYESRQKKACFPGRRDRLLLMLSGNVYA